MAARRALGHRAGSAGADGADEARRQLTEPRVRHQGLHVAGLELPRHVRVLEQAADLGIGLERFGRPRQRPESLDELAGDVPPVGRTVEQSEVRGGGAERRVRGECADG